MTRREFAFTAAAAAPPAGRFEKGICSGIFPREMAVEDMFAAAKDAGFRGVELPLGTSIPLDTPLERLQRIRDAADKAGCAIVSLWCSAPLSQHPLNSADAAARAQGVAAVRQAVDICATLGCDAMLLVPGRLGEGGRLNAGYEDTWNRVTACLRELVPYAARKKVCITPENVWNKFLVSPLEMRSFVDQFKSPWLQTLFDTGNIMQYGYPQDWIRTLGSRIRRVHLKDYKLSARSEQGRFVGLLEGDVDWKDVMKALVETGYRGFLSPEYGHNAQDPEQLRKISAAVDKILALA